MRIVKSVRAMQGQATLWRRQGTRISLVPTMGYLHEGHLSLVRRARQLVRARGEVVVSIYVNPTQFAPGEDLARYPRDFTRDARLCRQSGVDVLFAPADKEMYPASAAAPFTTYVVEESLSCRMEGASRPTHFRGVTTVVAKLFQIIQPDVAVFGAKDYQQAAIIRRMVRDLNFPVRIVVAPTRREPDGLAMSSRNQYLHGDLRRQAMVLWKSIESARARIHSAGRPIASADVKQALRNLIQQEPDARLDYVEFFDPKTLAPVAQARPGVHMALAVYVGKTRLIDNARI